VKQISKKAWESQIIMSDYEGVNIPDKEELC